MATGVVSGCEFGGGDVRVCDARGGVERLGFVGRQAELSELGRAKLRYLAAYWRCCAGVASETAEVVNVSAAVAGSVGVAEARSGVQASIECYVRSESDKFVESDASCGEVVSLGGEVAGVIQGGGSKGGIGGLHDDASVARQLRLASVLERSGVECSAQLREDSLCSARSVRLGGGICGSRAEVGTEDVVRQSSVSSECGSGDGLHRRGSVEGVGKSKLGPNGGVSKGRGPNYERNCLNRLAKKDRKKRGVKLGDECSALAREKPVGLEGGVGLTASDELKKSFDERRIAENRLATQRAEYNFRRNAYLQKSRVSEQKWETERLTSDEKLRKITEARLGASPGFAKTIVEEGLTSSSVPSLSDGTVSPNSSISVEEVQKMNATIEKLAGKVAELEMVNKKLVSFAGNGIGSCSDDEDEDEEDPRDKGKPYLVLRGECVPRKGEYHFKTDQFRNGNKVMAIDGKIVELNWKGKPARYIGGVEDITMPSEKDPYENLVNYNGYIPPMF